MAAHMGFRPTILVGVGGTGCEIAERVYRRACAVAAGDGGRIGVLGIDTDANDITRLRAIDARHRIQISSTDTIYQILAKHPDAEQSFSLTREDLPDTLLNMRLIDGAAQIRMFTHLAFHTALKTGSIQHRIGDMLALIARHDSRTDFDGAVNILVTGSLAGATGSGSFLQTALLLRRLAEERSIKASLRGVFMLPDVFVRGASLPSGQIENVLANGYASLKELNGAVARAERQRSARNYAYGFGPGLELRDGEIPFQSVTLVDFENSAGGNLGTSLENYKEMVARAVYLQIFTPVGQRAASVTINDALSKISAAAASTSNMYGGIGVSAVVYPAESMADYLAVRFAREVLAGDWLRLDRMYTDRVRRFEEQRAAGNLTVRLQPQGDAFLDDLDQLALRERIVFFMEARRNLYPKIITEDREEIEAPQHGAYLDALLKQILDTFWGSERLKEVRERSPIDSGTFRNLAKLESLVRTSEYLLDDDLRVVENSLFQRPEDLFVNVLSTEDDLSAGELREYHLQSYIVQGGPHPVQVRAFLYALRKEAARRRDAIDLTHLRRRVMRASSVFEDSVAADEDDPSRGNPLILKLAARFSNPGIVDKVTGKPATFIGQYTAYYNSSINHIRRYAEGAATVKILDLLIAEVDALSQTYAGLFTEVGRVLERLEEEVRREEARHETGAGAFTGNLFVFAEPEAKRTLWDELRLRTAGLRQAESANHALNASIYKRYREDRKQHRPTGFRELRRLFETAIIDGFAAMSVRGNFASVWKFSVVEALKREAQLRNGDWRERLKQAVDRVAQQAEPFLSFDDPSRGQPIIFWALSPKVKEEYNSDAEFAELFTLKQGEQPLVMEEFSDTELLCVNNRVNLELKHLAKLNPGGRTSANANETRRGNYFGAYTDRIRRLVDEEIAARGLGADRRYTSTITPHIHRDWHRGAQLPEIFPDIQAREQLDVARAFLVALGLGIMQRETDYDSAVINFSTIGRAARGGLRGRLAASADLWEAFRAFERRSDLVRATLDVWAAERAALTSTLAFDRQPVVNAVGGAQMVTHILDIAAPRTDIEQREQSCRTLFAARYLLLMELADPLLPHLDRPGRRQVVDAFEASAAELALTAFAQREGVRGETLRSLREIAELGRKDGKAFGERGA